MNNEKWDVTIVTDLLKLCNKEVELTDFVNKYWERFKPIYINVFKYIESDGDVYLLVRKFFNKIIKSDIQPLFQSDNQLFSYFKMAVKNENYDLTYKKEIVSIPFSAFDTEEDSESSLEENIPDNNISFDEMLSNEMAVQKLFKDLSEVLSEPYIQELVLLYKGYSLKEIRKELGMSYATINNRLWTIRNVLEEKFGITKKNFTLEQEKDNIINLK
jgi:DNA-directed RNA polymerase specialized sigma24 family protein